MNIASVFLAVSAIVTSLMQSPAAPCCTAVEPTVTVEDESRVFTMTVEDYVACVVAGEVPHAFCEEAIRAQAVAARTYLYYCLENGSHPHKAADICTDPSHCCAFLTEDELAIRYGADYAKAAYAAAKSAAHSTKGEILTYESEPILAVWHSSSEGYTEDSGNVWLASLPYLAPVKTPEKAEVYGVSFTLAEVKSRLRGAGIKYNGRTGLMQYNTTTGRCDTLCFGNAEISGNTARAVFGLKSTDFTAEYHDGRLYFLVRGYGHGVGMSQYGANTLAEDGSTYPEILAHYYKGSELTTTR